MKLATWNVNSIRAREERLVRWLEAGRPDVVCLQELKVTQDVFPFGRLQELGYHAVVNAQRTYNGVCILAREEPRDATRGFEDEGDDDQARFVSARVGPLRVASAYVPNGASVGSEKWSYKLEWLRRLRRWLDRHVGKGDLFAVCGDFNVAPESRDVCDPQAWEPSVLFHPEARTALSGVLEWGLVDAFRLHHQAPGFYSWWDYRMLAFPKNQGLRIDHVFLSEPLAARCTAALIDRNERKGKLPSDHAPVIVELDV
jgi:exodeoxyribonuclease-3